MDTQGTTKETGQETAQETTQETAQKTTDVQQKTPHVWSYATRLGLLLNYCSLIDLVSGINYQYEQFDKSTAFGKHCINMYEPINAIFVILDQVFQIALSLPESPNTDYLINELFFTKFDSRRYRMNDCYKKHWNVPVSKAKIVDIVAALLTRIRAFERKLKYGWYVQGYGKIMWEGQRVISEEFSNAVNKLPTLQEKTFEKQVSPESDDHEPEIKTVTVYVEPTVEQIKTIIAEATRLSRAEPSNRTAKSTGKNTGKSTGKSKSPSAVHKSKVGKKNTFQSDEQPTDDGYMMVSHRKSSKKSRR